MYTSNKIVDYCAFLAYTITYIKHVTQSSSDLKTKGAYTVYMIEQYKGTFFSFINTIVL